jgi:pimeloyl-ACP methyl ester carboxylesterase
MWGVAVEEGESGGLPCVWRRAPGPCAATLHLHGVPGDADDLEPFLLAHGGIAPDLPGFGRSAKRAAFDGSPVALAAWLEAFTARHELREPVDVVAHGLSAAVALAWGRARPGRLRRLVLLQPGPPPPDVPMSRLLRAWRTTGVGELAMGFTGERRFRRALRRAAAGTVPESMATRLWSRWDQGSQRAALRLARGAGPLDPDEVADVAPDLLVACGAADPYLGAETADAWGPRLRQGDVEVDPLAGHWPWLEAPAVVDRVTRFLRTGS